MHKGWYNSVNISEDYNGLEHARSVRCRRKRPRSAHTAYRTLRRRIGDLPIENGPFGGSPLIRFERAQVRTTGLAFQKLDETIPELVALQL
jgi:hypothetical protein